MISNLFSLTYNIAIATVYVIPTMIYSHIDTTTAAS